MLWKLDPAWLMMAVAVVAVIAFFFGSALNAIMRDDGFGPFGNMVIFTAGFFVAILAVNSYGIAFGSLTLATATGLGGAFILIATLALVKAGLSRL
ncbi:hypothetical protein [Pseudaminobacter soli (ex Li et al. 2025)]|uniref:GlsB/YeaQ/YmgE family stress response membrane protein n=1 Tax=Pseudaminobacter soli (ex Li et al. 2025) TaxID=1295366 RepID=A0A2P7SAC5_9HYPH|nr:hypothetical protein [Mesorhizobium soli]PSJ59453.1 hypothetical protein C7I85_17815 [Mesorhizobium soli]